MIDLDKTIQFVEKPSSDFYALKVLQGPYSGVIYTYGKVQLHEDEANDTLKLKYDFKIDEVPDKLKKEDLDESKDFKNFIGDILVELFEEKIYNDKLTNANTQSNNE